MNNPFFIRLVLIGVGFIGVGSFTWGLAFNNSRVWNTQRTYHVAMSGSYMMLMALVIWATAFICALFNLGLS